MERRYSDNSFTNEILTIIFYVYVLQCFTEPAISASLGMFGLYRTSLAQKWNVDIRTTPPKFESAQLLQLSFQKLQTWRDSWCLPLCVCTHYGAPFLTGDEMGWACWLTNQRGLQGIGEPVTQDVPWLHQTKVRALCHVHSQSYDPYIFRLSFENYWLDF